MVASFELRMNKKEHEWGQALQSATQPADKSARQMAGKSATLLADK